MADSQVEIRIGATVDSSLAASTAAAKDQINQIKAAQDQLASGVANANQQITQSTQQETKKQLASYKDVCSEIFERGGPTRLRDILQAPEPRRPICRRWGSGLSRAKSPTP